MPAKLEILYKFIIGGCRIFSYALKKIFMADRDRLCGTVFLQQQVHPFLFRGIADYLYFASLFELFKIGRKKHHSGTVKRLNAG